MGACRYLLCKAGDGNRCLLGTDPPKGLAMKASRLKVRILCALGALAASAAVGTSSASAGLLVATANGCPSPTVSQPFSKWGDSNKYFLAPGGAFESGDAAWTLGGGAKVVSGNEPFYVHGSRDARSL